MVYDTYTLLKHINRIREEIGHETVEIDIKEVLFDHETNELWIITDDRPDKSAIIGKGGWVVGRLREELGIGSIHVESYSDFLQKEYRMNLSLKKLESYIKDNQNKLDYGTLIALNNLIDILRIKLENLYSFNFYSYFKELEESPYSYFEAEKPVAVVALSGGTDSSFSLILAKKLGFNPIAITVDPGTIVLPRQFKQNIDKLVADLDVSHKYIEVDYADLIEESFTGRFHPCGRCSKVIEETVYRYALDNDIPIVIFGDMLATGSQCITEQFLTIGEDIESGEDSLKIDETDKIEPTDVDKEIEINKIIRLNLPASLSVSKLENKSLTVHYNLNKFKGFGCPLLYEVHKKFPHMKKYSIQRILRETRSGVLEPGEALDLIWSFYNTG
ncbi:7-cyano-7-deazaguanine synthase [uncultured Methanobrevibacter sp.]|uniref:7-cyano-7-deazaguanine synthase n=1 Tax=uncultured Methanobrevibacter sp. TaxID=253161 RepID=UPI0025DB4F11|nr:7-cyano-7-deazaguanine synthase [uncultured Methanobrevibacter sp.]